MSKFITTTEITYSIENLIKNASVFLILVTPYIKIPARLQSLIERKRKLSSIPIFIICKEKDWLETTNNWFQINNIRIVFNGNLHAKCYVNEESAILTSMNLYEFSMINNIEFGILVDKEKDLENYSAILEECNHLVGEVKEAIKTISILELAEESGAIDVRIVHHQETGNDYVHLVNSEGNYLSIKIGDKVQFKSMEIEGKLKELINNYTIYTGENLNGRWFTFNPPLKTP